MLLQLYHIGKKTRIERPVKEICFFLLPVDEKKKKEEREYYCPLSSKRNIICARGARQLTWVCELTHFLTPGEVWVFQVSFPTSQSSVPSPLLSARRAWFSEHWMLTQVFQAKEHFKVLINIHKTKSTIFCRRKKSEKAWQGGQHGHFYPALVRIKPDINKTL